MNRGKILVTALVVGLSSLVAPAFATVPMPSDDRLLVGGTEALRAKEGSLGRSLDVVRVYRTWSPTSLPTLDMTYLRGLAENGRRSLFLSAVVPWASWKAEADRLNSDGNPANNVPVPYCKWRPTDPQTGQPMQKSWFAAFADGSYDVRLRTWLTQVESLGDPDSPVLLSLMPEVDRLDATSATTAYRACVGTPAEFRAGWSRAHAVAAGTVTGGASLNASDGTGGHLLWVPVFTDWSFTHTSGVSSPERSLVVFKTGLPPASAPPAEATLSVARATPWMAPTGTWDHVGIDVFNFSGAIAGVATPTRVKVDDPATSAKETDQWRSLDVLTRPVLLWSQYNAPRPGQETPTVFLAEVGSVPDPTRPTRRPDWIREGCTLLQTQDRIVGALYFDANTVRLSRWSWTKRADGAWSAASTPTGVDDASVARWGSLMASPRAGGTGSC